MAKPKRSKTNGLKEGQQRQLTIIPDYGNRFPAFYSNYIQVSHTASEVYLDCCLLALPYNLELEGGKVTTPIVARIIFPPKIMTGLIKALDDQAKKQQETAKLGTLALPMPTSKPKKEGGK